MRAGNMKPIGEVTSMDLGPLNQHIVRTMGDLGLHETVHPPSDAQEGAAVEPERSPVSDTGSLASQFERDEFTAQAYERGIK